ncbi:hypothetical protein MASR2M44_09340 [Bacteroidota bacterium]
MRSLHKREVKREVLHQLPQSAFTRLAFSRFAKASDLPEWEDEQEFFWQNQEYDVVSTIETSDSLIYYAWCDEKDTQLEKLIQQASSDKPHQQNSLTKDLAKWIGIPILFFELNPFWFHLHIYSAICIPVSECVLQIECPPPRA